MKHHTSNFLRVGTLILICLWVGTWAYLNQSPTSTPKDLSPSEQERQLMNKSATLENTNHIAHEQYVPGNKYTFYKEVSSPTTPNKDDCISPCTVTNFSCINGWTASNLPGENYHSTVNWNCGWNSHSVDCQTICPKNKYWDGTKCVWRTPSACKLQTTGSPNGQCKSTYRQTNTSNGVKCSVGDPWVSTGENKEITEICCDAGYEKKGTLHNEYCAKKFTGTWRCATKNKICEPKPALGRCIWKQVPWTSSPIAYYNCSYKHLNANQGRTEQSWESLCKGNSIACEWEEWISNQACSYQNKIACEQADCNWNFVNPYCTGTYREGGWPVSVKKECKYLDDTTCWEKHWCSLAVPVGGEYSCVDEIGRELDLEDCDPDATKPNCTVERPIYQGRRQCEDSVLEDYTSVYGWLVWRILESWSDDIVKNDLSHNYGPYLDVRSWWGDWKLYLPISYYAGHLDWVKGKITVTATISNGVWTYENTIGIYEDYTELSRISKNYIEIGFNKQKYWNSTLKHIPCGTSDKCHINITNVKAEFPSIQGQEAVCKKGKCDPDAEPNCSKYTGTWSCEKNTINAHCEGKYTKTIYCSSYQKFNNGRSDGCKPSTPSFCKEEEKIVRFNNSSIIGSHEITLTRCVWQQGGEAECKSLSKDQCTPTWCTRTKKLTIDIAKCHDGSCNPNTKPDCQKQRKEGECISKHKNPDFESLCKLLTSKRACLTTYWLKKKDTDYRNCERNWENSDTLCMIDGEEIPSLCEWKGSRLGETITTIHR